MDQTSNSPVIRKCVSLLDPQVAIIEQVEKDLNEEFGRADFSKAVRYIVNEYGKMAGLSPAPKEA